MFYRLILLSLLMLSVACQEQMQVPADERYPWQITLTTSGSSSIFGVVLNETRLADAVNRLGRHYKIALFAETEDKLSLEVYYADFTRSGLSGRLVLTLDAGNDVLQTLKSKAGRGERLESGVIQYKLGAQVEPVIRDLMVRAMTYLPYADLKPEVAKARFGTPAEVIRSHAKAEHWLYPDKGLDMILTEEGRDILQYVPPNRFADLVRPLKP